jgi:hypothetical protein
MKRKLVILLLLIAVIVVAVMWVVRSFDWAGMFRSIHGH